MLLFRRRDRSKANKLIHERAFTIRQRLDHLVKLFRMGTFKLLDLGCTNIEIFVRS
jgi:hypothetical protein